MSNPFFWKNLKKLEYRLLIFLPSMLNVGIKWGRCQYGIPISRITNAFVRRDRDITHTETNSKVGCETERTMAQTCFPSNGPDGRLSRKDKFEHQILGEIPSRIHVDLFEAIEELCKYYIDRETANFRAVSSRFIHKLFKYWWWWWFYNYISYFILSHIDTIEVYK